MALVLSRRHWLRAKCKRPRLPRAKAGFLAEGQDSSTFAFFLRIYAASFPGFDFLDLAVLCQFSALNSVAVPSLFSLSSVLSDTVNLQMDGP